MRKPELATGLSSSPRDCTGDCGYGPCNCSGVFEVSAYTRESVEALVDWYEREIEVLRQTCGITATSTSAGVATLIRRAEDCERAAAAIVLSAGGEVRVPGANLLPRIELQRFEDPTEDVTVFRARRR